MNLHSHILEVKEEILKIGICIQGASPSPPNFPSH